MPKMREKRRRQEGYFTIEAAFVVPLTMLIVVELIFSMLYVYNKCIQEQQLMQQMFPKMVVEEELLEPAYAFWELSEVQENRLGIYKTLSSKGEFSQEELSMAYEARRTCFVLDMIDYLRTKQLVQLFKDCF